MTHQSIYDDIPECNYANQVLLLKFKTDEITKISKKRIYYLMFHIDREHYTNELYALFKDLTFAIKTEAGIFEYAIVYLETKNITPTLFRAIYIDKYTEICDNFTKTSSIYNPNLVKSMGTLDAQNLAFSTPQELNVENWETTIKKYQLREEKRKNIKTTDLYKCNKCNERKCTIFEMQTRSADEPITKFITCLVCGNVFKK